MVTMMSTPPPTCRDRVAGQWRRPSSSTQSCSLFGAQSLAAHPPLPRLPLPRVGRSADPRPQSPGGGVGDVPTTITLAVAEMQGCFGAMPHLLRDFLRQYPSTRLSHPEYFSNATWLDPPSKKASDGIRSDLSDEAHACPAGRTTYA